MSETSLKASRAWKSGSQPIPAPSEQAYAAGRRTAPHKHLCSDETFYIRVGTITYLINDEIQAAGKGAVVNVPRSTRHALRVDSDRVMISVARLLAPQSDEAFRAWQGMQYMRDQFGGKANLAPLACFGQCRFDQAVFHPDAMCIRWREQGCVSATWKAICTNERYGQACATSAKRHPLVFR